MRDVRAAVPSRCHFPMRGYNRVWDTTWPMRFYVEDGRLFTVEAPRRTAGGWRSIVRVAGGGGEGEYDAPLGYLRGCGTAIGFTIRWWWETTGEWLVLSRRRPDLDP